MTKATYNGPALFSLGFRPFFLAAVLFGVGVVPVWWLVWRGTMQIGGPFAPTDWHVHEMIFGYAAAVIAGFLFTAVPNWTGRMPARGWPLVLLVGLWIIGRFAVAGLPPLAPLTVAVLDSAFLFAIAVMIAVEIVAGRNWRNLMVVVPVTLLFGANVLFHAEAVLLGSADVSRRLGLAVVIFLVTLIGGRIVPSFTRNWLVRRGETRMPAAFGKYDRVSIVIGGLALTSWSVFPENLISGLLLAAAGVLHLVRLTRWRGAATWRSPLLLMLHAAYAFVPIGLLAAAAGVLDVMGTAAGMHLLGIGAVGGMTVAVMIRATQGHTGRDLTAGPALTLAFILIVSAALVRAVLPEATVGGLDGIALAALFWTLGYGIVAVRLLPWLVRPKAAPKAPSPRPST